MKKAKNSNVAMYVSCGLQDGLLGMIKAFEKAATENGVNAKFDYSDGAHEWLFWNKEIKKFLAFALE